MSRSRNWCFTLNNPSFEDIDTVNSVDCVGCIYQHEMGEEGTEHLQGFFHFGVAQRLSAVKVLLGRAHWEVARDPIRAVAYCQKTESRLFGPFRRGNLNVGQGQRLQQAVELIKGGAKIFDVAEADPCGYIRNYRGIGNFAAIYKRKKAQGFRHLDVSFYIGAPGSGKTRQAMIEGGNDIYKLDRSNNNVWWDGYDGESTLLIDDFYGWIPFGQLLNILDGYELRLDIKGGHTFAAWTRVIITSNVSHENWYTNEKLDMNALRRRVNRVIYFSNPDNNNNDYIEVPIFDHQQYLELKQVGNFPEF